MVTAVLFDFKRRVCKPVPSVSLVAQRFGVSMRAVTTGELSAVGEGFLAQLEVYGG